MADKKNKDTDSKTKAETNKQKRKTIQEYEKLLDQLKYQRDQLEDEMKREYYTARRYVRSNPEESIVASFAGGLLIGIILGSLTRR